MGRNKLTEEDRVEIRRLFKEGHSRASLAAQFSVKPVTISRCVNPNYYRKTLDGAMEYQRENAKRIRAQEKETRRRYHLSYNLVKDAAVIQRLDQEENISDYIRALVTDDIAKKAHSE